MNAKLDQAVKGQTVKVTWAEVGIDHINNCGFPSLADMQNWATCFGLTVTDNGDATYTISKSA